MLNHFFQVKLISGVHKLFIWWSHVFSSTRVSSCLLFFWMSMNVNTSTNPHFMFTWGFLFFTKVKSGFSCFNKKQYPCCKSVLHFTCGPEIVALQTRCESKGEENHSAPYPDELCKSVVDVGTAWHEETAARAQIVEKEQLLILWHKRMNTKKLSASSTSSKFTDTADNLSPSDLVSCSEIARQMFFIYQHFEKTEEPCEKYLYSPGIFF